MLAGCAVSADWRIGPSVVTTEEEAGGWWLVADTGYTNIPDTPTPRRTPRPLGKHGSLWHHVIVWTCEVIPWLDVILTRVTLYYCTMLLYT